jgi:hypothetical protein
MKTIPIRGDFIRKEGQASAAITPGHLIEFGGAKDLRVHSTIGGQGRKAFALENDLIGRDIDTVYNANDVVQYGIFQPGAEVYAWLQIGESCAKGDFLESDGTGCLQVSSTPVEGSNIAVALEAITGGGVKKRVKVEVL